ncbi:MAG: hypothetical protein R3C28_22935 [Pirellulaceae bacterium]
MFIAAATLPLIVGIVAAIAGLAIGYIVGSLPGAKYKKQLILAQQQLHALQDQRSDTVKRYESEPIDVVPTARPEPTPTPEPPREPEPQTKPAAESSEVGESNSESAASSAAADATLKSKLPPPKSGNKLPERRKKVREHEPAATQPTADAKAWAAQLEQYQLAYAQQFERAEQLQAQLSQLTDKGDVPKQVFVLQAQLTAEKDRVSQLEADLEAARQVQPIAATQPLVTPPAPAAEPEAPSDTQWQIRQLHQEQISLQMELDKQSDRIQELTAERDSAKDNSTKLSEQFHELRSILGQKEALVASLEREVTELRNRASTQPDSSEVAAKTSEDTALSVDSALEDSDASAPQDMPQPLIGAAAEDSSQFQAQIAELASNNQQLTQRLQQYQEAEQTWKARFQAMQQKLAEGAQQLQQLDAKYRESQQNVHQLATDLQFQSGDPSEITKYQEMLKKAGQQIELMKAELGKAAKAHTQLKQQLQTATENAIAPEQLEQLRQQLRETQEHSQALQQQVQQLTAEREQKETEYASLRQQFEQTAPSPDQVAEAERQRQQFEQTIQTLEAELQTVRQNLQTATEALESERSNQEQLRLQLEEAELRGGESQARLIKLEGDLQSATAASPAATNQATELEQENDDLRTKLEEIRLESQKLKNDLTALHEDKDRLVAQLQEAQGGQREVDNMRHQLSQVHIEKQSLWAQVQSLNSELQNWRESDREQQQIAQLLDTANEDKTILNERIQQLEAELDKLRSDQTKHGVPVAATADDADTPGVTPFVAAAAAAGIAAAATSSGDDDWQQQRSELESKLQAAENSLAEKQTEMQRLVETATDEANRLQAAEQKLVEADAAYAQLQDKHTRLANKAAELEQAVSEAQTSRGGSEFDSQTLEVLQNQVARLRQERSALQKKLAASSSEMVRPKPSGRPSRAARPADSNRKARVSSKKVARQSDPKAVRRRRVSGSTSTAGTKDDDELGRVYLSAPKAPDDLTQIKGIGKGYEEKLNRLGIYTFEQIQVWNKSIVAVVSQRLKVGDRIKEQKWVQQAKKLAKEKDKKQE